MAPGTQPHASSVLQSHIQLPLTAYGLQKTHTQHETSKCSVTSRTRSLGQFRTKGSPETGSVAVPLIRVVFWTQLRFFVDTEEQSYKKQMAFPALTTNHLSILNKTNEQSNKQTCGGIAAPRWRSRVGVRRRRCRARSRPRCPASTSSWAPTSPPSPDHPVPPWYGKILALTTTRRSVYRWGTSFVSESCTYTGLNT